MCLSFIGPGMSSPYATSPHPHGYPPANYMSRPGQYNGSHTHPGQYNTPSHPGQYGSTPVHTPSSHPGSSSSPAPGGLPMYPHHQQSPQLGLQQRPHLSAGQRPHSLDSGSQLG